MPSGMITVTRVDAPDVSMRVNAGRILCIASGADGGSRIQFDTRECWDVLDDPHDLEERMSLATS